MRFWVIAALTAVTLAVTACGAAPAEDRSLRTVVDQTQTADGARVTLDERAGMEVALLFK